MRVLMIVGLVLIALFMVAAVVAWNLWKVWGLVGLFLLLVVCLFLLKKLAGRLLRSAFLTPFKMKGKVLRGAELSVHGIAPAARPEYEADDDEELDEEDFESPAELAEYQRELAEERREQEAENARYRWLMIDVTITPQEASCDGFSLWEPFELLITDPSVDPAAALDEEADDGEIGTLYDVMIWDDEQQRFGKDECGKYGGPIRLHLHVGVEPGHQRIALRYYFEHIGEISLPPA